jgi:predicted GNAT family N-acyltransferase
MQPHFSSSIDQLELREVAYGSPHYHAVVALRQHVLRSPLGLTYTPDQLAQDVHDRQFVALMEDQLVGGVMLHEQDKTTAKLRQFVVTPSLQGFGIGSRLLRLFEQAARESGYQQVVLSARETATNFYRKHGYETEGERYLQVGLPHVMMHRKL